MGVRTCGPDIKAGVAKFKADRAAREEAEAVVDRWDRRLATGCDMLWSPTIRAALLAGTPWLDVFCPGCGTSRAIDLRTLDRHPLASVGTLVLDLRCSWCPGVGTDAEVAWPVPAPAERCRNSPALTGPPTTKSHHAEEDGGPDLAGGIGVEAGTVLFGEERVPNINFHLHCHRLEPYTFGLSGNVAKKPCCGSGWQCFQGGGSGEGRGRRPSGPSSRRRA